MPSPLTNAAERGTIEIEKESLPVRRLARFIYYLEKVADSLAGRLLFHAFEQFHHQCNDDSEYHHHQGENFKVTQSSPSLLHSFPSVWGYVNRGFRPSDRRPAAREQLASCSPCRPRKQPTLYRFLADSRMVSHALLG